MKKLLVNLALLGVVSAAVPAFADRALYESCAACHGDQAEGKKTLSAPRLAGQNARYLTEQLDNFRSGARGTHADDMQGLMMAVYVKNLNDGDIESLASFLSKLKLTGKKNGSTTGDVAQGKRIYAESCLACHGVEGKGVESLYTPNLRILSASYLERQLDAYRNGWRGDGEQGTTRSKSMRSIVTQLNGKTDVQDLLAYLTH